MRELDSFVQERGGMLVSFIPDRAVLVAAPPDALQEIAGLPFVAGVGDFMPGDKVGKG